MGVRGASPSNNLYNHYQQPSPTSCMKSLPQKSAPTSPTVRDALPPSRTSPSTSAPKPAHPTPPPLQLPDPSQPPERPPPRLSSTFVSPQTVPSLGQPHYAQLREQQDASAPFGQTLLAATSHSEAQPQPARSLSLRARLQKVQEQVPPTPDSPDELDTIEIRFYPFPPPRHPLTYPLPTSASSFSSKPLGAHGFCSAANEKVALRKRLLRRWRNEKASESLSAPDRSHVELPSNGLKRAQSATNTAKRKRTRTSYEDEDDDQQGKAVVSTSNTHSDGFRGKRARNGDDTGKRTLPSSPSAHHVDDNERQYAGARMPLSFEEQIRFKLGCERKEGAVDANRALPSPTFGDGSNCRGSRIHSPRNVQSRQGMLNSSRAMQVQPQLYAKSNGQFSSSSLQQLQQQIDALKQRRLRLEDNQYKEISRKAAEMCLNSATKEQRLRLKSDIEKLSPRAIRDMLLHISRRCRGFRVVDHEEVQLQVDLLPPELVGELELIVMLDKGEIELDSHAELQKVRTKLWNGLEEYRSMLNNLNKSEANGTCTNGLHR